MTGSPVPSRRGVFLVFEGGEGSGKSTQVRSLADSLQHQGRDVLVTREPGGSQRGERIRELILGAGSDNLDARTEALLFAAARADHAQHIIRPALLAGQVVISDRYVDSSVAYQGIARGLGEDVIRDLSTWATDSLFPDLTVVLDIDPVVGLARAEDANRLEAEPLAFHRSVRQAFLDFARDRPDDYCVIPADDSPGEVHSRIRKQLTDRGVLT